MITLSEVIWWVYQVAQLNYFKHFPNIISILFLSLKVPPKIQSPYVISSQEADRAVIAQNKAFEKEILAGIIEEAKVQNNLCIISIVGENMYRTPGIAGKMFRTLGTNGINVFAIAQVQVN